MKGLCFQAAPNTVRTRVSSEIQQGRYSPSSRVSSSSVPFNVVFVHPNELGGDSDEGKETIVVTATVTLPADVRPPKPIESLTAEVIGWELLSFKSTKAEINTLLYDKKEAEAASGLQLEAGQTYRLDFTLHISNNGTPREYIGHSSVHQAIVIKLKWADQGLQKRYKDLEVKRRLYILCVSNRYNNLAYYGLYQSVVDRLGPMIALFKTPNFTVGGHLHIGLYLANMPPDCSLQGVKVNIRQQVTLISRQRSHYSEILPNESITILDVHPDDLQKNIDSNQNSFQHFWISRIEPSHRIRSSTLKGSNASIVIVHKLELCIHYTYRTDVGSVKPLVYSAAWPITLASCGCRVHDLKLPSYEDSVMASPDDVDEPPSAFSPDQVHAEIPEEHSCICNVALDHLLDQDEEYKQVKNLSSEERFQQEIDLQRVIQRQGDAGDEEPATSTRNYSSGTDVDERKARQLYQALPTD